MLSEEDLDALWDSFEEHIDECMPTASARCPYCHTPMYPTFDNYGNIFMFCVCADWVVAEEDFKKKNSSVLMKEPDGAEESFREGFL